MYVSLPGGPQPLLSVYFTSASSQFISCLVEWLAVRCLCSVEPVAVLAQGGHQKLPFGAKVQSGSHPIPSEWIFNEGWCSICFFTQRTGDVTDTEQSLAPLYSKCFHEIERFFTSYFCHCLNGIFSWDVLV